MGELQIQRPFSLPPPPLPCLQQQAPSGNDSGDHSSSHAEDSARPTAPDFDPSRMVGIIRRKALIKDLAALYHAECLSYCQQLLELQNTVEEPPTIIKVLEEPKKETLRPSKRIKKSR